INPSGTYLLFSIITDTTGDTLAQAQTTFDIEQSSGYMMALSGMIEALPTVVTRPNDFLLSYSVTNIGNIDLDTLIIKEVIVDAALQSMIYSRIDTISLPINGTVLHDSLFSSLSFDFGDYILGLYAVLPINWPAYKNKAITSIYDLPEFLGKTVYCILIRVLEPNMVWDRILFTYYFDSFRTIRIVWKNKIEIILV
ncbi:unnamed protein product, partial [marine sediment metagenome]